MRKVLLLQKLKPRRGGHHSVKANDRVVTLGDIGSEETYQ